MTKPKLPSKPRSSPSPRVNRPAAHVVKDAAAVAPAKVDVEATISAAPPQAVPVKKWWQFW